MRVLLANDTDGRDNVGCQLTSRTLSGLLRRQGFDVVSAPWRFASHLKVNDRKLWSGFTAERLLAAETLLMLATVEYGDSAMVAARSCDLVMFQPEGTISDHHSAL